MKRGLAFMLAIFLPLSLAACGTEDSLQKPSPVGSLVESSAARPEPSEEDTPSIESQTIVQADESEESGMLELEIMVEGQRFRAELYDNETTRALMERMPLSLDMDELNGNEKYHYFADGLPENPRRLSQIQAGDLMLYGADCLVLFYENLSTSYSYTPLGYIAEPAGLAEALGTGNARVSFSRWPDAASPSGFNEEERTMKVNVTSNGKIIVYELNNSQAARDLYAQLPLTTEVENFSTNEKVFYPPEKLNIDNTPTANAGKGTLAYYAPWGDVVMFYDDFSSGSGLYELGRAVSGEKNIETLSGTIEISPTE